MEARTPRTPPPSQRSAQPIEGGRMPPLPGTSPLDSAARVATSWLGGSVVQSFLQIVGQDPVELALREAPWSRSWSIILSSSSSCIHRCTPVAVASVEGLIAALCSCFFDCLFCTCCPPLLLLSALRCHDMAAEHSGAARLLLCVHGLTRVSR